jgi:hypothetical protein
MWQNPYTKNYNPMAGVTPPGQLNLNQFSSAGVIAPPPNASPFPTQPELYQPPPTPIPADQSQLLHMAPAQQMGSMVVSAYENFKKSIVDSKEDGDDMILTVRVPIAALKQDQNFSFLFK